MSTIALAPCATIELTSEMDFSREPPPTTTICVTFEHFAASERAAAYDSCDHALIPKPSRIASLIGFDPQNGRLKTPDFAISFEAFGHVTLAWPGAAPAETAPIETAVSNAASTIPRQTVLLLMCPSSTPVYGYPAG